MVKKWNLVVLALMCQIGLAWAQTSEQSIRQQFEKYNSLIEQAKYKESIEYVHPGIFDFVSKDLLVEIMEATFNDENVAIKFGKTEIKQVSPVQKVENAYYAFMDMDTNFAMKMGEIENMEGEDKENFIQLLKDNFTSKGLTNSYDPATNYFSISTSKKTLAYSTDQTNWKFITLENDAQLEMLKQFIPAEIISQF